MIDWKKVAKHLFSERNGYVHMWESRTSELWEIAAALAEKAGTPCYRELHTSCMTTLRLALERLQVQVPEWAKRYSSDSEAQVRLLQLTSCLRRGDKLDPADYMGLGYLKVTLVKFLLK
jgi:hypothetical protein